MQANSRNATVTGRLIGYARVSTEEQGTDPQLDELRTAGCDAVREEHASGADRTRPVLASLLREIRPGETLVVVRLDRLARSVSHLLDVIEQLEAKGAHFRSLRDPIDTTTSGEALPFTIRPSRSSRNGSLRCGGTARGTYFAPCLGANAHFEAVRPQPGRHRYQRGEARRLIGISAPHLASASLILAQVPGVMLIRTSRDGSGSVSASPSKGVPRDNLLGPRRRQSRAASAQL